MPQCVKIVAVAEVSLEKILFENFYNQLNKFYKTNVA